VLQRRPWLNNAAALAEVEVIVRGKFRASQQDRDGRWCYWGQVGGIAHRIVCLPDGTTVHNAMADPIPEG